MMRVLVFENEEGASDPVVDELQTAGIDVARCHDATGPAFPCNGLRDDRSCPLDGETISVAVLTGHSSESDPDLASREQGARCALRQHIPLVVVGERAQSPLLHYATSFAPGPESAVAAVRAGAEARLPAHERLAAESFRLVLDTHDLPDVDAGVTVTHRDGGLRIVLQPSVAIPEKIVEIAGVRAMGAVRAIDPHAKFVSVTSEVPGPTG